MLGMHTIDMYNEKTVLVTGAGGFIGQQFCERALSEGYSVKAALRRNQKLPNGVKGNVFGDFSETIDWSDALIGVDVIIHLAARAHVVQETEKDVLAAYRSINVDVTRRLAEQAVEVGVKRFVFLSSIGVHGVHTNDRGPFFVPKLQQRSATQNKDVRGDELDPVEDYAISKWEAEKTLWEVSARTGLEVVIIRSPLVYGPGVKGNFLRLLQCVARGVPLPLGAIRNQRSLVGLDNLVDLLIRCVDHPAAAGQTFLVSDGQDLSTPELIRMIARAMGKPPRLLPMPVSLLLFAGRMAGQAAEVDRLVASLQIDSLPTRKALEWTPPEGVEDGIKRMVDAYMRKGL